MNLDQIRKSLPENLAVKLAGCAWREITIGESASKVFRLKTPDETVLYLKIAANAPFDYLLQEKLRMDWLRGQLAVPKPLMFVQENDASYLLISEIPGDDASGNSFKGSEKKVIEQAVKGLKLIHRLPIDECPFDARIDYKIKLAEKMLKNGLVDESDFDESRAGRTAEDLYRELLECAPASEELVFTHGDYCLPNIILENGKLSGFIDLGSAGVADCYRDIALLARSVEYNFGSRWTEYLYEQIAVKPDARKIHFYTLLDEFF